MVMLDSDYGYGQVPTICIEHIYVWNNTSVIVDEVLSHRIGLIPLNVDPALVDMKDGKYYTLFYSNQIRLSLPFWRLRIAPTDQATDRNTLVFRLAVACTRNELPPNACTTNPAELYTNSEVLSSHLSWEPQGEQAVVYADNPPAPTNPNIVLVKLRPGQEVEMEIHAIKGVGKDHAKFSPVG